MPTKDKEDDKKTVATHRKARHYFEILEVYEAGLQLRGPEVKSLRSGRAKAASTMIQPPMLEPMRICGPSVSESITATESSRHRDTVPSAKSPLDAP